MVVIETVVCIVLSYLSCIFCCVPCCYHWYDMCLLILFCFIRMFIVVFHIDVILLVFCLLAVFSQYTYSLTFRAIVIHMSSCRYPEPCAPYLRVFSCRSPPKGPHSRVMSRDMAIVSITEKGRAMLRMVIRFFLGVSVPRGSKYLIIKELRLKDHDYSGFWALSPQEFGIWTLREYEWLSKLWSFFGRSIIQHLLFRGPKRGPEFGQPPI